MFLRKLAKQINDMDIAGPWGESVTNKAIEGIEFLGKRDDFWNQIDTSQLSEESVENFE